MPAPTTPPLEGRNHVDWLEITDPDPRNLYRQLYRKSEQGTHCFCIGHVYHGLMVRNRGAPINVYSPTELARVPDIKALVEACAKLVGSCDQLQSGLDQNDPEVIEARKHIDLGTATLAAWE